MDNLDYNEVNIIIMYKEGLSAKILVVLVSVIYILMISIWIKDGDYINLLWSIPLFIYSLWAFIGIWYHQILIDENQITQSFGSLPYKKIKILKWENIDLIVKDGFLGITVYRLLSKKHINPRSIDISGIKNMDLMINEIIKRATNAKLYPENEFLKLKEKQTN